MDGQIKYSSENGVGTIVISRPNKMNSITKDMAKQLQSVAFDINQDDEVKVVLLTGDGEKSFSTGSDINLIHQYGTPFELRNRMDYCVALRSIRKPMISKIKGYALGGGLEMVLTSDIRIANKSAKFGASEVKHGWIAGSGATQILGRTIGYNKAAKMVLTGEMVDADKAYELGFINEVIDDDKIDAYVDELIESMTKQSSIAMQLAKHDLRMSQNVALDIGLQHENDLFAFSFTTEDSKEGMAAFAEKRKPNFDK